MPNPRVQLRIAQEIYEQLPGDPDLRSAWIIDAIMAKINPPTEEDRLGRIEREIDELKRAVRSLQSTPVS